LSETELKFDSEGTNLRFKSLLCSFYRQGQQVLLGDLCQMSREKRQLSEEERCTMIRQWKRRWLKSRNGRG